ncbi:MAG: hypothetical protein K2X00_09615 [Nitrospiraceae bacterium]|nr:hypothetical protein [Nitrospiraceae bacterium]
MPTVKAKARPTPLTQQQIAAIAAAHLNMIARKLKLTEKQFFVYSKAYHKAKDMTGMVDDPVGLFLYIMKDFIKRHRSDAPKRRTKLVLVA